MFNSLSSIYAITPDKPICHQHIKETVLSKNISILQYRRKITHFNTKLKEATQLKEICDDLQVNFIINDDINLANELDCGVHLGKNDSSIILARKILGDNAIIGISCYNNINAGIKMQEKGASYVAFGSIFTSKTKPNAPHCSLEILQQAREKISIPIVAIGGINFDNMHNALQNGANSVAMIDALWES